MNKYKWLSHAFVALILMWTTNLHAQSTFQEVYNIIQTKCTGCHGGDSPQGNLDLDLSEAGVYNALVGTNPTNPSALSKGYKLADPGYPERSYLLHKLATADWDNSFSLEVADGNTMPPSPLPALSEVEIELFRQWIMFGTPQSGTVVDRSVLEDYYENGLALPGVTAPPAPDPSEGIQIRLGPIFLAPLQEEEYFKKHLLDFGENVEVTKTSVDFNDESHHFILYQLSNGNAQSYAEGLRNIDSGEFSMTSNSSIGVWQNSDEFRLPEGAAYKWPQGTHLDLNFHVKNYSPEGVLACDAYININTQEDGIAEQEMFSVIIPINLFETFLGEPIGNGLVIPNDGEEHVFSDLFAVPPVPGIPFPSGDWYLWQLSSHTHARGIDYDIYISDGGEPGEQIYEGFYNFNYTFNQGFFDWEHPAIRYFEPLKKVDMSLGGGLIQEATYINDGPEPLEWGYTTDDEMMLMTIQFTAGPLSSSTPVVETASTDFSFTASPNPYQGHTSISYQLNEKAQVSLEVFNVLGERVQLLVDEKQAAGKYQQTFSAEALGLPAGMYLVNLTIDGQKISKKIIEMNN